MRSIRHMNPLLRAVGVISAVTVLATGVTFAALQSSATLTNNTIETATADLQINNTDDNTNPAGSSDVGFAFDGVVPGGADSQVGNFTLQNAGSSDLNLVVGMPSLPTWSTTVNNSDVDLTINCTSVSSGTFSLTASLQDVWFSTAALTGGPLQDGDTATCTAQISMDATALTGTSATASDFTITFTGTGV